MKRMNVSEFRRQCLGLLEHLPAEGVLITKRGQPIARLVPVRESDSDLIGSLAGSLNIRGAIFTTEKSGMLNLDTHILLYALAGNLLPREEKPLAGDRWSISAIVLWEISKLHQKGRIGIGLDNPLMKGALERVEIWPINREVCLNIGVLDFKSDPADELIASTSLVYKVPLVTRDRRIRTSKLVPLA